MTPTDEHLMTAYAEGEVEAFEVLYHRHKRQILGYLFNNLRDRDEAEEVFQTVFAKLHAARDKYRIDIPFLPWIFTIARNALIDHCRRKRTYRQYMVTTEDAGLAYADQRTPGLSIGSAIAELSSLDPTQRRALELRYDQELSFAEIASQLQTSSGNARQMVSRAIRRLRRILVSKEVES
jgi:RNA polymerase sigma factor (sigma-70 family)